MFILLLRQKGSLSKKNPSSYSVKANTFVASFGARQNLSANSNMVLQTPYLSEDFLRRHHMALLSVHDTNLVMAVSQDQDYSILEKLKASLPQDYSITTQTLAQEDIQQLWDQGQSLSQKSKALGGVLSFGNLDKLMETAITEQASDVHIVKYGEDIIVQFRIAGQIVNRGCFAAEEWMRCVIRLKVLANLDIAETRRPQSGSFEYLHLKSKRSVRVSFHPTLDGEKASLRFFLLHDEMMSWRSLGVSQKFQDTLNPCLEKSSGLILMVGPTGSGKTTTTYAMLQRLLEKDRVITTLEDPVEIKIRGIQQTEIQEKIGFDYAAGIRSLMRQDPDVIFVGEIRDEETAQMCFRAAMTGHLVISSLHAQDCQGALLRLFDLGIRPSDIYANLLALASQRLVSKRCRMCEGSSCSFCAKGCAGRVPIEEVVLMTQRNLSYDILESKSRFLEAMRDRRALSFEESLQAKIFSGEVTPDDARRALD